MHTITTQWSPESICLNPSSLDTRSLAVSMYDRTCRTNFTAPGFCVVNVGSTITSEAFRQFMVDIKREMSVIHKKIAGKTLVHLSAARFDQQETTRPHLDAGPDECFLMLGYEPSEVNSEIEITDYAKCAFDRGMNPKELLAQHNPMFKPGFETLMPYRTRVPCFSTSDYQLICINNSSAAYSDSIPAWQGTLHTATILSPDETKRRVINSMMIASVPLGTPDDLDTARLRDFVSTAMIRRRGYDKPHLNDDT